MTYKTALIQRITPFLILIPIVCFWTFLNTYAVNIPWMDDIESFLAFLLEYLKADTLSEKIDGLLKPNNEHRILFGKLLTVGMYYLTGTVNFRWLILIASLWIAGLLFLFYRLFRTTKAPLIAFVPIALLLLHPQYHLTSLFAITALQHQTATCLVFWVVYMLAKPGAGRFAGAFGMQLLASFSMSNGLFGWFAGTATLLVQRRFKEAGLWLAIGVVTIFVYLHGFPNAQGNDSSVTYFLHNPHLVFLAFFTFSGALFDFFPSAPILPRSVLPTLAGFGLIGLLLWMLKRMLLPWPQASKQSDSKAVCRNFLVGAYVFLTINALIIAFLRPRFGYFVMLISNYTLYSSLLAIIVYLNVLNEFATWRIQRKWIAGGLVFATLVWSMMYFQYWPRTASRKQLFEAFSFNQKHNGIGLGASFGTRFAPLAKVWMDQAVEKGIYQYPTTFYTPYEQALLKPNVYEPLDSIHVVLSEQEDRIIVQTVGWPVPKGLSNACFIAKSDKHTYLFPVPSLFVPGPFFLGRSASGLSAEILTKTMHPGSYRLGILMSPNDNKPIRYTDREITIR